MSGWSASARDTVGSESPSWRAMSFRVTRRPAIGGEGLGKKERSKSMALSAHLRKMLRKSAPHCPSRAEWASFQVYLNLGFDSDHFAHVRQPRAASQPA